MSAVSESPIMTHSLAAASGREARQASKNAFCGLRKPSVSETKTWEKYGISPAMVRRLTCWSWKALLAAQRMYLPPR